jgi:transposase
VRLLRQMNRELDSLEQELAVHFELHPDAEIYRSLPGLGIILGARVLAEFGDDRTRFAHPKARKCYTGTPPITKASGTRQVVLGHAVATRPAK